MSILSVKDLSYTYAKDSPFATDALHHVEFSAERGEIIGIIGPTGSGKSTLVQHLNGLIRTEPGHVFLDNCDIWEKPKEITAVRHRVGLVFQYPEYQLFEETAYADIAYGPRNIGLNEEEVRTRVAEAAETVGIAPELLDQSPFDFSGGQKRRIAIAGVIAMRPDVLILDEPSAGLDPVGRRMVFDLIRRYREETGAAVMIVSHNMEDMAKVADKLLVLYQGEVKCFDTPQTVFSDRALLSSCHLEQPAGARFADDLRHAGVNLPDGILTIPQLADALAPILKGGQNA